MSALEKRFAYGPSEIRELLGLDSSTELELPPVEGEGVVVFYDGQWDMQNYRMRRSHMGSGMTDNREIDDHIRKVQPLPPSGFYQVLVVPLSNGLSYWGQVRLMRKTCPGYEVASIRVATLAALAYRVDTQKCLLSEHSGRCSEMLPFDGHATLSSGALLDTINYADDQAFHYLSLLAMKKLA